MPPAESHAIVSAEKVERAILVLRGEKVILDGDVATLYGVQLKALLQAVKRNPDRFPIDFMFQLTNQEVAILRSQIVTSRSWGGRRTTPYAFTEHGVAMLSSILRSPRAIQVNIQIMRTFGRLRQMLSGHRDLAAKLAALEKKYDGQFKVVFEALRQLMEPEIPSSKKRIGFRGGAQSSSSSARARSRS